MTENHAKTKKGIKKPYYNHSNRDMVQKMWKVNKDCYWCKLPTVKQSDVRTEEEKKRAATFDHLYHKSDNRRRTHWGKDLGVLACYECNQKRGGYEWFNQIPLFKKLIIILHLHKKFKFIKKYVYSR